MDKISIFSSLLPLAVLLFFNKEKMTLPLKVILVYVIYCFINDIALTAAYGLKNSQLAELLLRIFTAVEYSMFAYFFYLIIKSPIFKKIIIGLSIVFFSITFYNYINTPNASFDSIPVSTESILIIIYCLYYFYESINQPQLTFLYFNLIEFAAKTTSLKPMASAAKPGCNKPTAATGIAMTL